MLLTIIKKLCQEEHIADNRFLYQIYSIGKYLDNMFMKVFKSKLVYPVTQVTYICYIKERISRYILSAIKKIICFAAMPVPIDYTQESKVWACATSMELLNKLKNLNLNFLKEGQISGMNGLFLALAKKKGFPILFFTA